MDLVAQQSSLVSVAARSLSRIAWGGRNGQPWHKDAKAGERVLELFRRVELGQNNALAGSIESEKKTLDEVFAR